MQHVAGAPKLRRRARGGRGVWTGLGSRAQAEFKDLVAWWKELLGQAVTAVRVSDRLATSPAIVVTSQYGWSANMERIMKAQARGPARRARPGGGSGLLGTAWPALLHCRSASHGVSRRGASMLCKGAGAAARPWPARGTGSAAAPCAPADAHARRRRRATRRAPQSRGAGPARRVLLGRDPDHGARAGAGERREGLHEGAEDAGDQPAPPARAGAPPPGAAPARGTPPPARRAWGQGAPPHAGRALARIRTPGGAVASSAASA